MIYSRRAARRTDCPSFGHYPDRHPPNNWRSCFGGSVWEWDDTTEEYCSSALLPTTATPIKLTACSLSDLHSFLREQPDLNWENPAVRKAIYRDAVRFWLDRGVDGFRIDVSNMLSSKSTEICPERGVGLAL